jgi:3-methylfumaryl-CoA hydratase
MCPDALPALETLDILTVAQARRVASMLDIDPQTLNAGDPLPHGWHFALLAGGTQRRALRSDGFPGLGISLPEMNRKRLLLSQRDTSFHGTVLVGAPLRRMSRIESITEKTGRNGPLSIVRIDHRFSGDGQSPQPATIDETQTYFLADQPAQNHDRSRGSPVPASVKRKTMGLSKVVTPDDILLFQYSALGFNTHRIHFDRDYATRVEGYPDLVVNGGLATLLATEYLRTGLGKVLKTLSARHLAPLYVNRPMTIAAPDITDAGATLSLFDDDGTLAAELVMTFHAL